MWAIKPPVKGNVHIHGVALMLRKDFFSYNITIKGGATCIKCGTSNLGRYKRIDCEFWPGDIESYCLKCWAKQK